MEDRNASATLPAMELPPLPEGYTARGATMQDAEAVTELVAASNSHDVGSAEVDVDEIQGVWSRPSVRLDLDEHLVFDEHDRLVGWAELYFAQDAQAVVRPEWRGRGLGTYLLSWVEQRAGEMTAEQNLEPLVRQSALDSDRSAQDLFGRSGYTPVWSSWILEMPLDQEPRMVQPPEDVTIRVAGRDEARAVHALIDTAFNEWESHQPERYEDWRAYMETRGNANPSPWFVAVADDAIVGAATTMVYPEDGDAWIEEFAVARDHRRQGVGTALLTRAFGDLREAGAARALLSTDSRGAGRHFYEDVGMRVLRSYTKFQKQLPGAAGT
jgi:mycothiol synthase